MGHSQDSIKHIQISKVTNLLRTPVKQLSLKFYCYETPPLVAFIDVYIF